jgi:flagellar basal-body rod modification protein FlgD
MATDSVNKLPGAILGAGAQAQAEAANAKNGKTAKTKEEKNAVGKEDFLKLLITQLQNQDPMNPMDSQQFAVQLAQFSSVEQLVSINKKLDGGLGGGESGGAASLSQFLGKQVTLKDQEVNVSKGKGPDLMLDVPIGTQSLRVDFYDKDNKKIGQETLEGTPAAGKTILSLDGVTVPDGDYDVRVLGVKADGTFGRIPARQTGMVEGFTLSPNAALLIGGKEVLVESVQEVSEPLVKAPAAS